jgi:hypothetical protein
MHSWVGMVLTSWSKMFMAIISQFYATWHDRMESPKVCICVDEALKEHKV